MSYGWPVKEEFVIPKKTKSSIKLRAPRNRYTVNDELKSWIFENIKGHWFLAEKHIDVKYYGSRQLWIHFTNSDDAVLYKLVWGGV